MECLRTNVSFLGPKRILGTLPVDADRVRESPAFVANLERHGFRLAVSRTTERPHTDPSNVATDLAEDQNSDDENQTGRFVHCEGIEDSRLFERGYIEADEKRRDDKVWFCWREFFLNSLERCTDCANDADVFFCR